MVLSAVGAQVDSQARTIDIQLEDGRTYCCSLAAASPRLRLVDPSLLEDWEWIGPHVGVHWPAVDEDLSVEQLVAQGTLCEKQLLAVEPAVVELRAVIQDIHGLTTALQTFERQYGILSDTFYLAYLNGEDPGAFLGDDWAEWVEVYETLLRRQEQYQMMVQAQREPSTSMLAIVRRTARRRPVPSVT